MKPDAVLYRSSATFFALFLLFAVAAFWPSYFSRLFEQPDGRFHVHGAVMTLWSVLLVVQGVLIRGQHRTLHKALGKASYAVAPALVLTTASFVHYRIGPVPPGLTALPSGVLYFLALTLNSLVAFALLYGLAIYHRREPAVHGRFMLCTVFPLFTPITDRLIGAYLPGIVALVPRIEGAPVVPIAGFLLADAMLLGLAIWDWAANRRLNVFPAALAIITAYHVSVLTFHALPAWEQFGLWFLRLPLS
jgi:hypothetical protein